MNITILANRDLASSLALNYLVSGLAEHQLTIFLSDQVGASTSQFQPLRDLQFFEQQLFNEIVFPAIDNQQKAGQWLTFNGLASVIGKPVETLNSINESEGLKKLAATQPDLILSVRFGKILKAPAITLARHGVLNLHSGLLPQYQGVMATFWAMLNREESYGTTLHFIDSPDIDAGPIIKRSSHALPLDQSYLENVLHLYPSGCQDMIDAVATIARGETLSPAPPNGQPSYYTFPQSQHLAAFSQQQMTLFDSQHVMGLVKAYQSLE